MILGFFCFLVITNIPYVGMFSGNLIQGNYLLWPLFSISGIICMNNISRYIDKIKIGKAFGFVGRYSMNFYVLHWIILSCILFVLNNYVARDLLNLVVKVIVAYFSTLILIWFFIVVEYGKNKRNKFQVNE